MRKLGDGSRLVTAAAFWLVISGFGGTALAQDGESKPKLTSSRKSELDRLKSRLDLSDSQFEKVVKIFTKADEELKALLTANQKDTFKARYDRSSSRAAVPGCLASCQQAEPLVCRFVRIHPEEINDSNLGIVFCWLNAVFQVRVFDGRTDHARASRPSA